jgi:IS5 family transposase
MVQTVGPGVKEALYHSLAMRGFVGIDLGPEPAPDETTARRFRHCSNGTVWRSGCSIRYCGTLQGGLTVAVGTIIDAAIINAPSSTKNAKKARNPKMHQTKKGKQ